jgi:hypothetical protein
VLQVDGGYSTLLQGDPDKQKYGNSALPKLLEEGWHVATQTATTQGGSSAVLVLLRKGSGPIGG